MNKKSLLYLLIAAVIAAIVGWVVFRSRLDISPAGLSITSPQDSGPQSEEVTVGYGASVKNDLKAAVAEAVQAALVPFKEETPEYAVLFSTVGYDSEILVKEVRALLPNTKLQGGTSMYSVFNKDGYYVGEVGSLTIMLISSPKIDFGVGAADIDAIDSAEEAGSPAELAGKQAILAALADAGRTVEEPPKLVYMIGSFNNEEGLLAGIEGVLGKEIPVVGGSAFDDDATGKWRQFYNDDIYVNGVILTAFYTDFAVGWAYQSGYDKTSYRGTITKAEGRTIYEIDNGPALDVYNDWTGGLVDEIVGDSHEDSVVEIEQTALNPIAKILGGKHGETHYLTMHPYFWDLKGRSITLGVNVAAGDEITLVHGTWETNLNHAQTTPAQALASKNIKKGEAYFGINSYCLGKMLTIPEEERPKIPLLANQALGGIPFIGANTGGEQGLLEGVGSEHGGLVNDIIIFGPAE